MKKTIQVTVSFPQTFEYEYDDTDSVENIKDAIKEWASYLMESSPSDPEIVYSEDPRFEDKSSEEVESLLEDCEDYYDCRDCDDPYDANIDEAYVSKLRRIGQYEMVDFGIEFKGGSPVDCNNTSYTFCANGYGNNPREAFEDLIKNINNQGFRTADLRDRVLRNFDLVSFPEEPNVLGWFRLFRVENTVRLMSDNYKYHLAMRWNEV